MTKEEVLDRILRAYSGYYNVDRESPAPPFAAEAEFSLHDEQYFLIRSARISEADAKEFAYFALEGELTPQRFRELAEAAWKAGSAKIHPGPNTRSQDVSLLVIADSIPRETRALIARTHRSLSHRFGFWGYTQFRAAALDVGSASVSANRMGEAMKKTLKRIMDLK